MHRLRGRIAEPPGWISLENITDGHRWVATAADIAVRRVDLSRAKDALRSWEKDTQTRCTNLHDTSVLEAVKSLNDVVAYPILSRELFDIVPLLTSVLHQYPADDVLCTLTCTVL
eukprot:gene56885-biopygen102925